MNEFKRILDWITKNYFKIIIFFISLISVYVFIKILIPIFNILGFFLDVTSSIQEYITELDNFFKNNLIEEQKSFEKDEET